MTEQPQPHEGQSDGNRWRLADLLEERAENQRPLYCNGADIYSTLVGVALGRVDWQEVAEHLLIKMEEQDRG